MLGDSKQALKKYSEKYPRIFNKEFMKMKKRKKIFRPKRRYKIKRRNTAAIKFVAGAAVIAVLVFVGYSAAGPVGRYLEDKARQTEAEPYVPESTDVGTEPPAADIQAQTEENVEDIVIPSASENTAAAVSETQPAVTEPVTEPVTVIQGGAAYAVDADFMTDIDSLNAALDDIKGYGFTAVIFPMKTEGGFFNYTSDVAFVKTVIDGENPVKSPLTAEEIANAAVSKGLRPVALVSVLADNNRYGDYRDGSYRSTDDSTWLDTSPEKGGKPWLSPFDETAQEYLCDLITELGNSGFGEIICDDFIFPEFRSTDIELLGENVSPYSDRYLALTRLACMLTEAGGDSGAQVMLRITANSIIKDYSELFRPEELSGCVIMVDYSEDNISNTMVSEGEEVILDGMAQGEKIRAVFSEVERRSEGIPSVPMLKRESMSAEDFGEAVKALSGMGYDRYYVY